MIATACLEKAIGVECDPVCESVVKKVVDTNTLILSNGQKFDVSRYSDISLDTPDGQYIKSCLESTLLNKRITYYVQGNGKISIRNKPIRC